MMGVLGERQNTKPVISLFQSLFRIDRIFSIHFSNKTNGTESMYYVKVSHTGVGILVCLLTSTKRSLITLIKFKETEVFLICQQIDKISVQNSPHYAAPERTGFSEEHCSVP